MTQSAKEILERDESESLRVRAMDLEAKETSVIRAIQKDKEENKIYHFRTPNPPQKELLDAWLDWYLKVFTFTGANRIGKTTIGTVLAYCTMFGFFPWSRQKMKFPHRKPRKVRYIGQDWEKHIMRVVTPALKEWWPKQRPLSIRKNNVGAEAFLVDEETGSSLEIMSNKQDADLHEGWEGDLIVYDEPPKRDIRVANARGLVDRNGRELFCMTLLKEAWVDQEVIKARLEDGAPDPTVFNVHGEIYDNVGFGLTQEGVELFSKKLKPEERDARLLGVPSYMSGLVLPQFSRQTHILKSPPAKIPLDWILDIHIDFHPSKPWAVIFKAVDARGFHYIIDEIWDNGSWKAIGEETIRRIRATGCRVSNIIIDPLSKGDKNSDLNEESVFDKLHDLFYSYGYSLRTASKDKSGGIHIIQGLLITENKMPALFFFPNLKRTIMEIEGWMYDDKGIPLKENDDMVEGLYRLCLLDTQYEEMEDEDENDYHYQREEVNQITGY